MGGGGAKSRLCTAHHPLNPKLSLYTLLFTFLTFLYFKFLVIASEYIARVRQAIIFFIDCHAKNHSRSFLLAMTAKTANALPCHTETLCRSIHRKITLLNSIYGYFATAQYDSKCVIASRFCENGVAIHKFSVIFTFWIATLALLTRNDGGFCHFEPFAKRRKIQRIESTFAILRYFACAQYDKFRLLLKNNGYFHSNFKAKIQIFHSKFKAFCKFNSFHKFISNFKPYTRLFYIFTPNFRAVFTDKFCTRS